MKKFSILILLFLSAVFFAQTVIYLDKDWKETTKDQMVYYRETKKQGNFAQVKDFYKDGTLQMEGNAIDPTLGNEKFEGKVTWYYPDGKMERFTHYKNGEIYGKMNAFDQQGRLTGDLFFTTLKDFYGTTYDYKNPQYEIYYNVITQHKEGKEIERLVYDEDKEGIRFVQYFKGDDSYDNNTKFYGDKGEFLGEEKLSPDGYNFSGVHVEYFFNPMRIKSIQKMNENGTDEFAFYYENGQLQQEKKLNENEGFVKSFDKKGTPIGTLIYKKDTATKQFLPFDGRLISFREEVVLSEENYENGKLSNKKTYNEETGTIEKEILFDKLNEYGRVEKAIDYENGQPKFILNYRAGIPYNGTEKSMQSELTYKNGEMMRMKFFDYSGHLIFDKSFNSSTQKCDAKVYNKKEELTYTYTSEKFGFDGYFTAEITQYKNGKVSNQAKIEEGILKSGKLDKENLDGKIEYEFRDDWIYIKVFDKEGQLLQESKFLKNDSPYQMSPEALIHEDIFFSIN